MTSTIPAAATREAYPFGLIQLVEEGVVGGVRHHRDSGTVREVRPFDLGEEVADGGHVRVSLAMGILRRDRHNLNPSDHASSVPAVYAELCLEQAL